MSAALPAPARNTRRHAPALLDQFREGYGLPGLRADVLAGLTVAIVALPLSTAIGIASGVPPERGLAAAIVGGFIVSALGGSRYQIGGPAGAFIVLVAAAAARHGVDGLILATFLSGLMLAALGVLRLGGLVRLVPPPVVIGFTAGIAVLILASQLRDLAGLTLPGPEPGPLLPKLAALWHALPSASPAALGVAAVTIAAVLGIRRWRPAWPAPLIAIALATLLALPLPVETIGTRFGALPSGLPMPALPDLSPARILAVLPDAVAFALLGAIESLLSATVADSMTGQRHRPDAELVAQGVANIGSALFGGIPVTGTIARTATNVRAGARGPVSGMLHSAFLLLALMLAAPLLAHVPLAALAGFLAVVAVGMAERHAVTRLLEGPRGPAAVMILTVLVVAFRDLLEGIAAGCALSVFLSWRAQRR